MPSQGQNKGVRVLDDFVCDAINNSEFPQATEEHQGANAGIPINQDVMIDPHADSDGSTDSNSKGETDAANT